MKKWKISKLDLKALELWEDYTLYKEEMFKATNRNNAPWIILDANKSLNARLEAMKYVLDQVIYK